MAVQRANPTGEIVFRLDRGFRKRLAMRGVMLLVVSGLLASTQSFLGIPALVLAGVFGAAAVGCAVGYVWRGRFRTVLTPQGIHIRGYFNRFVPWADVAGFQVRSHGPARSSLEDGATGSSWDSAAGRSLTGQRIIPDRRPPNVHVAVQVVRVKGHRLTLRAPQVTGWSSDSEFDDKVRLMQHWQRQYGAPPTVAMPS